MTVEEFFKEEARLAEEVKIFQSELQRKQAEYNNFVIANLGIDLQGPITHLGMVKLVQNVFKMGAGDVANQADDKSDNQKPETSDRLRS